MKKIITLILLFVTLISFGQKNEYKHAKMLYKDKLYNEANAILDKILNNEYGILYKEVSLEKTPLEGLFEMHCWDLKKECLLKTKDYKAAYTSAEKHNALFREFVGSSDGFNELASDELIHIKSLMEYEENQVAVSIVDAKSNNATSDKKDDIESKVTETTKTISDNKTTLEPSSATKTDNTETKVAETTKHLSDDKTVTLTVSGTGKTLEEAKLNALRSAIEQAFGAFISSKTEIFNDNLVKDEIVSVASGNVQKFDVVSQVEVPNVGYAMTLNATVSIAKLTSFAESKGVVVEFKGGMFGLKIKLQKLNEQAEIVAIKNLTSTCFDLLNSIIDFELKVSEPVKAQYSEDEFDVEFLITTKANNNFTEFNKYFLETIKKIALTNEEKTEYKKLNNPLYYLIIDNYEFAFRSKKTFMFLTNFFSSAQTFANSFKIFSNSETVKFTYSSIYKSILNTEKQYKSSNNPQILFNSFYDQAYTYYKKSTAGSTYFLAHKFVHLTENLNLTKSDLLYEIWEDRSTRQDRSISFESALIYETVVRNPIIKFVKRYKLSEIEKINEFKLEKIDINDFLKNRNLYMLPEPVYDYSCFLSGTKISTPQGIKSIENIKVGDEVICFDDKGDLHTSIVESINSHKNQDVYKYSVWNGESLYATPNHWVLTSENSFTEIGKVNEMLTLVDTNGGLKPITKVEIYGKETVYNFIVKDYHTYIANDIRVHNGGKGKSHLNISKK